MLVEYQDGQGWARLTTEALESLRRHPPVLSDIIGTQLVDDAGYCHRVGQKFRGLAHLLVFIQRIKVPRVQISIPTAHVCQDLFNLRLCETEFFEEPSAPQVMVVLIGLPYYVAYLQMRLIIIRPVLLTAIYGNTTIWTFEVYMRGRGASLGRLAGFVVAGIVCRSGWRVIGVWTVGMLSHVRCSFANLGYRRVCEGVEEVIVCQNSCPRNAFWVDIFIRLEWLLGCKELLARGRRNISASLGRLCSCRSFGGVQARGRNVLRRETEH
jgi:hypothetical protein